MRALGTLVLLSLLPLVPTVTASCPAPADPYATSVGGVYYLVVEDSYYGVYYDVSVWRETNGHAGLQRYTTYCAGGATLGPDRQL